MAIYGIGAYYEEDVSTNFINNNLIGIGWSVDDAPELHHFVKSLKVGDIVYIKSFSPSSPNIYVKAIGIIIDTLIRDSNNAYNLVSVGRNVRWLNTESFSLPKPNEKYNVRLNSLYEEFHPIIQNEILRRIFV